MGLVNTTLFPTVLSPRRRRWKPSWQKGAILQLVGCTAGRCSGAAMCIVFPVVHSIQAPGQCLWCHVLHTKCLALPSDCRRTSAPLTGLSNPWWDQFCWRFCESLLWHIKTDYLVPGIWLQLQTGVCRAAHSLIWAWW